MPENRRDPRRRPAARVIPIFTNRTGLISVCLIGGLLLATACSERGWGSPLPENVLRARLEPPSSKVAVIVDADFGNEIDDQFALVHIALRPDKVELITVSAAPFGVSPELAMSPYFTSQLDRRFLEKDLARFGLDLNAFPTIDPADGMERAFDEATRIRSLLGFEAPIVRGARAYFSQAPSDNPAADAIIVAAEKHAPVFVLAGGALTNVAAALYAQPSIAEQIVVVWTAGYPTDWHGSNASFNLAQDPAAARYVFQSGAPVVYVPGYRVGEEIRTSLPEIETLFSNDSTAANLLRALFEGHRLDGDYFARSKVLWDLAVSAYVIEPEWYYSEVIEAVTFDEKLRWQPAEDIFLMREVVDINRDALLKDLSLRASEPS